MTSETLETVINDILLRLRALEESIMHISTSPPAKIAKPMLRIADGTNWDPGAGPGLYLSMDGSTWSKL